jgi:hypothetical protein
MRYRRLRSSIACTRQQSGKSGSQNMLVSGPVTLFGRWSPWPLGCQAMAFVVNFQRGVLCTVFCVYIIYMYMYMYMCMYLEDLES